MPVAKARHILLNSHEDAAEVLERLRGGEPFEQLAADYSQCETSEQGGDLGHFAPGQMPLEVDEVVFSQPINKAIGPVQSAWGFHVIEVTERTGKGSGRQRGRWSQRSMPV